jgi:DNA-binding transcriptional ArsR family regulator
MDNYQPALNNVFHALADPTRRAVLRQLTRGPASITELAKPFDMALPSFMSDLIRSRKTGRVRTCTLKPRKLARAERWLAEQRVLWEDRTDRLAAYAEARALKETTS